MARLYYREMKRYSHDGFTTQPLSASNANQLVLTMCVHCDWIAAGAASAIAVAKTAHVKVHDFDEVESQKSSVWLQ